MENFHHFFILNFYMFLLYKYYIFVCMLLLYIWLYSQHNLIVSCESGSGWKMWIWKYIKYNLGCAKASHNIQEHCSILQQNTKYYYYCCCVGSLHLPIFDPHTDVKYLNGKKWTLINNKNVNHKKVREKGILVQP